jgi:hypothetical protein
MSQLTEAREARVDVAPNDVSHVCAACKTGDPKGADADPRHLVIGIPGPVQMATLPGGGQVPVQAPTDIGYHFDCHAAMGCDHCQDMLDHHDGSVKGKAADLETPDHLIDIEPGEFELRGDVLQRTLTKAQARKARESEARKAGMTVVNHEEAFQIHAEHVEAIRSAREKG